MREPELQEDHQPDELNFENPLHKDSAAWLDRQQFKAALPSSLSLNRFPPRLCLRYRKRWKSLGERSGLYGAWYKTSQLKDSINSRVVRVGG
ncbi:hypothetical protein TNCV_196751 [Trichonephila clavipes]|uniref:Uncharacterized protein n=1 Tax=Trichonephila clavipes TaxID=2585209 RepID=A0A8X6WIV1_TRICX|nr:hypothetical protein TNCV_196751 [Trichonephila clavipes]